MRHNVLNRKEQSEYGLWGKLTRATNKDHN